MAVNNTCSSYRILSYRNRIKPEAQLKDIHAGFFTGLDYGLYESIPSLLHTHTVAPQVCALSGCWQVVDWSISKWSGFASTALMPQTKWPIQEGFSEQAWGWKSDCLPDWLRSARRTWIFVSMPPRSPTVASSLPLRQYAHEYVAFTAYPESLIFTTHLYAWFWFISWNKPKTTPLHSARQITWWLVFSLW